MRRTETNAVQQILEQQQNSINEYEVHMSGLRDIFGGATSERSEHGPVDGATHNSLQLDEYDAHDFRASRRRGLRGKRLPGEKQLLQRRVAWEAMSDRMSERAVVQRRNGAPGCSSA